METPNTQAPHRIKTGVGLGWFALLMGIACVTAVLVAAQGYRTGHLGLSTTVQSIRWAATGALAGFVGALLALVFVWKTGARRKAMRVAGAALVINALVAVPPLYLFAQAQSLPRIHDISTDTRDPPIFVAMVALRSSAPNPIQYNPANAVEQRRGYPDIGPLMLQGASPAQTFARAERVARALGWDIISAVPQEGRLEATDRTMLLGFKDDIVVRIRPSVQDSRVGQGSIVDVRSVSRVGLSDIGTNAQRIRTFLRALQAP